jgi:hypothetical protein
MVQTISLQNHLALEALCSQRGDSLHVTFLFRALYLAYILRDAGDLHCDMDTLRSAEVALYGWSRRAEEGGSWALVDPEIDALKIVLTVHDSQLQSIHVHRYETACTHLLNYLVKGGQQLILGSNGNVLVHEGGLSSGV